MDFLIDRGTALALRGRDTWNYFCRAYWKATSMVGWPFFFIITV